MILAANVDLPDAAMPVIPTRSRESGGALRTVDQQ